VMCEMNTTDDLSTAATVANTNVTLTLRASAATNVFFQIWLLGKRSTT